LSCALPLLGSGLGWAALSVSGGEARPAFSIEAVPAVERVLQVQAQELWIGAGQRVENGLLVVADGRIRSVGKASDADPALPLVRHPGVVTAGLVGCGARSGARGELQDDTRAVMAAARAAYAFDPTSSDLERALGEGITAVAIGPGPANLVGGLGCVIKTAGGRVLEPEATLAVSLTSATLGRSTVQGFFVFGATEVTGTLAEPDGGPESSERTTRGTREPTSYAGAVATLERLFARGEGPFARARKGDLQVIIEAWKRHEVVRAALFAQGHGLAGAIRGAPLAGDPEVLAALKASGLGVIVGPYSSDQTRPSLESVKRLSEAGVPVAFALDDPSHAPLELRLSAARALQAGASRDAVWKALTEDAARLAGVGERAGKLASGREADFVLWSGDPLDLSTRVVAVYVDGRRAWPASFER
jgi:imidazolonepropionase-like amidohydrolase